MRFERIILLTSTFAAIGLGFAVYAYANPGMAACAIVDGNPAYSTIHEQLLAESRTRIQNTKARRLSTSR